jgi:hypothetical protein
VKPTKLVLMFVTLWLFASPGSAQTVGYAEAIDILARTCGKDIGRYCGKVHMEQIGACLDKQSSKVSSQCRGSRAEVRRLLQIRSQAQAGAEKTCKGDVRRLCGSTVRGKGHRLRCLIIAQKRVRKKCKKVLIDAGYM